MSIRELTLVYHSQKMLMTLDLNQLMRVLLSEIGDNLRLTVMPMTPAERNAAEDHSGPLTLVPTRFMLREQRPDGTLMRREDLEARVIREGRK